MIRSVFVNAPMTTCKLWVDHMMTVLGTLYGKINRTGAEWHIAAERVYSKSLTLSQKLITPAVEARKCL